MAAPGSRSATVWVRPARGPGDLAVGGGIIRSCRRGLALSRKMGAACSQPRGSGSQRAPPTVFGLQQTQFTFGLRGHRDFLLLLSRTRGSACHPLPAARGGGQNPLTPGKTDVLGRFRARNRPPNTLTR